jgi:hypothetical protein
MMDVIFFPCNFQYENSQVLYMHVSVHVEVIRSNFTTFKRPIFLISFWWEFNKLKNNWSYILS